MNKRGFLFVFILAGAGLVHAAHIYEETASVHDIMEVVQGPSMKKLSEMMKAGGPQTDDDWKHAREHNMMLGSAARHKACLKLAHATVRCFRRALEHASGPVRSQ